MEINQRKLEKAIKEQKRIDQPQRQAIKKHTKQAKEILECDLHINSLLDNTNGLSNADMLHVQLDKFREMMNANIKRHGAKIVFIHGKGEGVLRKALMDALKKKYPKCEAQDASFREYGLGGTWATVK